MEENFIKYIEQSIKDHWDLPALTDFKGATSSYKDVARKIEKLHLLFEHCGIRKGDKIALCSRQLGYRFSGHTFLRSCSCTHTQRV